MNQAKEGRHLPGVQRQVGSQAVRKHAWEVPRDASPGDVRHAADHPLHRTEDRQVAAVRLQQRVAQFGAQLGNPLVQTLGVPVDIEYVAHERVAVRVQAAGGEAEEHIAVSRTAAADEIVSPDRTDYEAHEVEIAALVQTRQLGGLTADQSASGLSTRCCHATDQFRDDALVESSDADIVKEEHGPGACRKDVVHAVVDDIDADGGVPVGGLRDFQLGADAIGAGDEQRFAAGVRFVHACEEALHAGRTLAQGRRGYRLDLLLDFGARFDIDAGFPVRLAGCQWGSFPDRPRLSRPEQRGASDGCAPHVRASIRAPAALIHTPGRRRDRCCKRLRHPRPGSASRTS